MPPAYEMEQQLIRRVRDGEYELFHELIQPYEQLVWTTTFAILGNETEAEGASQETVLKALNQIGDSRADARFRTWLIKFAITEARMRVRNEHAGLLEPPLTGDHEEENCAPLDIGDWQTIPSAALERHQIRAKLVEALCSLGQIYREVFVLRDMQHLSIAEISEVLGISTASVKTRLHRARLMLRNVVAVQVVRA